MTNRTTMWARILTLAIPVAVAPLVGGCSSSDSGAKPDPIHQSGLCSDDLCKAGNVCAIEGDNPAECHLQCAQHSDCPSGYGCSELARPDDAGTVTVCVPVPVSTSEGGYGTKCGDDYGKCTQDGFLCPGNLGDTDTTCTKLDGCETDADCPPAYWCGAVRDRACFSAVKQCLHDSDCSAADGEVCAPVEPTGQDLRCMRPGWCHTSPNDCPSGYQCSSIFKSDGSSLFAERHACVPRTYCSPCKTNADCTDPTAACIDGGNGEKFCSYQCAPSGLTCDPGSDCKSVGNDYYCVPKSGTCHGDATQCSTCRNDLDCGPQGICYYRSDSREHFCLEPCDGNGQCPNTPGGAPQTCCTDPSCGSVTNYCIQDYYYSVTDTRYAFGCWIKPCQGDGDCDQSGHAMTCEVSCDKTDPQLAASGITCDPNPIQVCVPTPMQ